MLRLILISVLLSTCKTPDVARPSNLSADNASRYFWLTNTFTFLMNRAPEASDKLYLWLKKNDRDFFDHMYKQPEFINSMAELGLYFVRVLDEDNERADYRQQLANMREPFVFYPASAFFARGMASGQDSHLTLFRSSNRNPGENVLTPVTPTLAPTGFWFDYDNDANNRHRKQANYILQTYFCEDLTPKEVAEEKEEEEVKDQESPEHGEDAAEDPHLAKKECYGCHFRLDPMGGFFREFSAGGRLEPGGIDFDRDGGISGDDVETYINYWRAKGELARFWRE